MQRIETVYLIRNKKTGLYAKSGTNRDRWSKEGKIFTPKTLKLHLRQFNPNSPDFPYGDNEVEIDCYFLRSDYRNSIKPSDFY